MNGNVVRIIIGNVLLLIWFLPQLSSLITSLDILFNLDKYLVALGKQKLVITPIPPD